MDDQRTDREGGRSVGAVSVLLVLVGFVITWPIYDLCYFAMANLSGGWKVLFFPLVPIMLAMRFGGAMLAGAGLFLPVKNPWLGAAFGFAVQVVITLAIYFTDPPM